MAKKKQASGYARVKAAGKVVVNATVTARQAEFLRRAAKSDSRSLTQFLVASSLKAAEKILGEKLQDSIGSSLP